MSARANSLIRPVEQRADACGTDTNTTGSVCCVRCIGECACSRAKTHITAPTIAYCLIENRTISLRPESNIFIVLACIRGGTHTSKVEQQLRLPCKRKYPRRTGQYARWAEWARVPLNQETHNPGSQYCRRDSISGREFVKLWWASDSDED